MNAHRVRVALLAFVGGAALGVLLGGGAYVAAVSAGLERRLALP